MKKEWWNEIQGHKAMACEAPLSADNLQVVAFLGVLASVLLLGQNIRANVTSRRKS